MIVGIDLGTTNTCVAVHDGERARIIRVEPGRDSIPSAVYIPADGSLPLVGSAAIEAGRTDPVRLFTNFKRVVGKEYHADDAYGFLACAGPDGYVWIQGEDRAYSPSELMAMLLYELRLAVERETGERPDVAVIGVPVGFDQTQKQLTVEAAERAGFGRAYTVVEPDAGALAYGSSAKKFETLAIFDWGGGTFDFSLVSARDKRVRVIANDGNSFCGGRDVDEAIAEWMRQEWLAADPAHADLRGDGRGEGGLAWARTIDAAEQAKIDLSNQAQAEKVITLPSIDHGMHLRMTLTRKHLTELTAPLISRLMAVVDGAMRHASRTPTMIDKVILVGGMSYMLAVREAVQAYFGKTPLASIDPKTVVALGAATRGAMIEGRIVGKLNAIASHALHIETLNDVPTCVIPKGAPVPVRERLLITSAADSQAALSLIVLQGTGGRASRMRIVDAAVIEIDPAAAGEPSVEVVIGYDEDGSVVVEIPQGAGA